MQLNLRSIFIFGLIAIALYTLTTNYIFTTKASTTRILSAPPKPPKLPTVTARYHNRQATVELAGEYQNSYDDFWTFLPSWKPHLLDAIDRYVDSATVFVDAGTWEGPALFYAASKARMALGIEADRLAYRAVKAHLESNPAFLKNTVLTVTCLSDRPEKVRFAGNGEGTSAVERVPLKFADEKLRVGDHQVYKVTCETLPDYLLEKGVKGNAKLVVKMDLQGTEAYLLPSLHEWVAQRTVKPVFFLNMHETLANAKGNNAAKILQFVHLFKFCGRELKELTDCASITMDTLEKAQDMILADYR